jgi:hypothetical protein
VTSVPCFSLLTIALKIPRAFPLWWSIGIIKQARVAVVDWDYQTSSCGGSTDLRRTTTGAAILSRTATPDFALLKLTGVVPRLQTWAGWNATHLSPGLDIVGIHHPKADYKRISFGKLDSEQLYVHDMHWTQGITEGGSSGSPLFDPAHLITGVLSTGFSSCTNPNGADQYTKFGAFSSKISAYLQQGLPDDALKGNQSSATALAVTPGTYSNLVAKINADDWFKITIPAGQRLILARPQGVEDIPVEVYRGTATTPAGTLGIYQPEITITNTGEDATYFLRAFVKNGVRYDYSLSLTLDVPVLPSVSTTAAKDVNASAASLWGTVHPNNWPTQYWFEYGTSSSLVGFSTTPKQNMHATTISQPVSWVVQNLTKGTTYYFRAAASNSAGTSRGDVLSFTTFAGLPSKPEIIEPANSLDGVGGEPLTFRWNPATDTEIYEVIVGASPKSAYHYQTPNTELSLAPNNMGGFMTPDAEIAWQVVARNNLGSTASDTRYFRTGMYGPLWLSNWNIALEALPGGTAQDTILVKNVSRQSFDLGYDFLTNSPQFTRESSCPSVLLSGAQCQVTLKFLAPPTTGQYSTAIYVTNTQQITVTGRSTGTTVLPTRLDFGNVVAGSTGVVKTVTIANEDSVAIKLDPFSVDGDFTYTHNCPTQLAAKSSCKLQVKFAPATAGYRHGTLNVHVRDRAFAQSVPLKGDGVVQFVSISRPTRPRRNGTSTSAAKLFALSAENGFVGTIQLNCEPSCIVSPTSVDLVAGTAQLVIVRPAPRAMRLGNKRSTSSVLTVSSKWGTSTFPVTTTLNE